MSSKKIRNLGGHQPGLGSSGIECRVILAEHKSLPDPANKSKSTKLQLDRTLECLHPTDIDTPETS
jgi:hypothetical protein